MLTIANICNPDSEEEIIMKSCVQHQSTNKTAKTNAQRQQKFRLNRKRMQQNESTILNLARKKNDAERSKRYRDRLKLKKELAQFDSLSPLEKKSLPTIVRKKKGKTKLDITCDELIYSQIQMQTNQIQPLINTEGQQIKSPSHQSFQAPSMDHDTLHHNTNIICREDNLRRLSCTECLIVLDGHVLYRCVQCPLVVMCADCGSRNNHLHHCVLRMPNIQVYNKVELLFEILVDIFNKKLGAKDDEDSTEETDQSDSIIKPVKKSFTGSSHQPAGYLTILPGEPLIRLAKIKTEPQADLTTPINTHLPPSSPFTNRTEQFNTKKRKAQTNAPRNKALKIVNVNKDKTSDKIVLENIKVEIEIEENELTKTSPNPVDVKVEPPDPDAVS